MIKPLAGVGEQTLDPRIDRIERQLLGLAYANRLLLDDGREAREQAEVYERACELVAAITEEELIVIARALWTKATITIPDQSDTD